MAAGWRKTPRRWRRLAVGLGIGAGVGTAVTLVTGGLAAGVPGASGAATTPTTAVTGTPPASYPGPGRVTGDIGVHDPTMIRTPEGGYLLVHTGDNVAIKTSADRTAFRNAGTVWPGGASWTTSFTAGARNLWAPDVSFHDGRYSLYYSASSFGSRNSAIFLATSPTGASGSWTHQGQVISTTTADNFNAIDPNLIVDGEGRWWLSFGSFWSGIKMIRINPATGLRSDTSMISLAARSGGTTAIEAPYIIEHAGYYYLFVSWDTCCKGADSTYRIMVGRSTSVTGPYVDRNGTAMTSGGGTQVLTGHGSIHGPGHQSVFDDVDGQVLVYHYYADDGSAKLGINLLGWDAAGWPYVY